MLVIAITEQKRLPVFGCQTTYIKKRRILL
nr:MAG TPA: hypothetical protein [Bacteriophage sp.]